MIHLPKSGLAAQTASLPAKIPFSIDYIRVLGPAQVILRQRFGSEMRNFLAALPQPLDVVVRIGMATDVGTRPRNEDSAVALVAHFDDSQTPIPVVLAAVADGVGGDADGHLASAITIQTLVEYVMARLAAAGSEVNGQTLSVSGVEGLLLEAISAAHYQIKARTSGGSSTLTCALIIDRAAYIAHVGDSRAYLLNVEWKDIELITHDHRRERQWQDVHIASNAQFESHPRGHVLYRSLGKDDQCEVDITRRNLIAGSRMLLCTNGISDAVSPAAVYAIVRQSDQPQDSCERLVTTALANNAYDDMTAILVAMPG